MSYTDVFGDNTVPPADYSYASFTLTANTTVVWPFNATGDNTLAKINEVTCSAGVIMTLPDATQVSVGQDLLVRNVGSNTLQINRADNTVLRLVEAGQAVYLYVQDNTAVAGEFGVVDFGVGTSEVDAASLVGYGVKALGASLNQSHPVVPTTGGLTINAEYRAKLVVLNGGTATFNLVAAETVGDDFFFLFRNDGTGTATLEPYSTELVDGMSAIQVQPSESLMLVCTGSQWYSVGYGRSVLYQFTQLIKDVSAGGIVTLSAAEASNKLITFIGGPASPVTVIVPSIVAVYYTQNSVTTAQTVTLKTAVGSGVDITQGSRIIALCDGTNVVSAQSAVANSSLSLTDGSASIPSLFFATKTNTGLYKFGAQDLGVTVNGSSVAVFGSNGIQLGTVGANATQRHTVPSVSSDTLTLNAATQTLTNKTVNLANNTLTGTIAQFNAALSDGDFTTLSGSETLTNKTVSLSSNVLSGTVAQFNAALSDGDFATLAGSETLTNKTVNLANNTLTGTIAQFNAALSDGDFGFLGSAQTWTQSQTFSKPVKETTYALTSDAIVSGNGSIQYKTLSGNTSFTVSMTTGESLTLMINYAGYTVTWPAITWIGGAAPVPESSGYTVVVLWNVNGVIYGMGGV